MSNKEDTTPRDFSAPLPDKLTIGDAYSPAMEIRDESQASAYLEALVERSMRVFGKSRQEAESHEKTNLGYYAGYYDNETRERVERLFVCSHPVFGAIATNGSPSPTTALQRGKEMTV